MYLRTVNTLDNNHTSAVQSKEVGDLLLHELGIQSKEAGDLLLHGQGIRRGSSLPIWPAAHTDLLDIHSPRM